MIVELILHSFQFLSTEKIQNSVLTWLELQAEIYRE